MHKDAMRSLGTGTINRDIVIRNAVDLVKSIAMAVLEDLGVRMTDSQVVASTKAGAQSILKPIEDLSNTVVKNNPQIFKHEPITS